MDELMLTANTGQVTDEQHFEQEDRILRGAPIVFAVQGTCFITYMASMRLSRWPERIGSSSRGISSSCWRGPDLLASPNDNKVLAKGPGLCCQQLEARPCGRAVSSLPYILLKRPCA